MPCIWSAWPIQCLQSATWFSSRLILLETFVRPLTCDAMQCNGRVRMALGEALRAARSQRADVSAALAGAAEALQAASDAAHGRWVKLLGARCLAAACSHSLMSSVAPAICMASLTRHGVMPGTPPCVARLHSRCRQCRGSPTSRKTGTTKPAKCRFYAQRRCLRKAATWH